MEYPEYAPEGDLDGTLPCGHVFPDDCDELCPAIGAALQTRASRIW